jgi:hypothetical protein
MSVTLEIGFDSFGTTHPENLSFSAQLEQLSKISERQRETFLEAVICLLPIHIRQQVAEINDKFHLS